MRILVPACVFLLGSCFATGAPAKVGHPSFLSPHSKPVALNGHYVFVANTPADTVDVIDRRTRKIVRRISVGVDPVGLALRPDGLELWVSNHVSDTVSVIDLAKVWSESYWAATVPISMLVLVVCQRAICKNI